jgi:hypothetical protein
MFSPAFGRGLASSFLDQAALLEEVRTDSLRAPGAAPPQHTAPGAYDVLVWLF